MSQTIPSFITPFGRKPERHVMKAAIFLDRDGVIIYDTNYLAYPKDIRLMDSISVLKQFQNGFRLIIITNQSGVARGYYAEEDVSAVHEELLVLLKGEGVEIDAIYYCPHHPEAKEERYKLACDCRKPAPGMIYQAVNDFDLDPRLCYMVGDKDSDIEAGQSASVKTIRVESDQYKSANESRADFTIKSVTELISIIR